MTKSVHDDVLDAALNTVKNQATFMSVCSSAPTTRTEAISTYLLADVTMAPTDYTVGNGDTNGRKVAVGAKSSITVDISGTATHIALCSASTLMYVTSCTSQSLTSGNQVNVPTWDIEIADPT